jgi:adenylate cyclase
LGSFHRLRLFRSDSMVNFADWIGSRRRWLSLRRTAWRGAIYALPLAVLFGAATARIAAPDLLDRMSLICFDLYQRATPRMPEADTPVRIVDIDDDSLKKIGQWPWPRTLVAQLIDKLREAGASVIAFDIDFAEPDRTSPKLLLPLMAQNGVGAEAAEKLLATLPDPDERLAEAMATTPSVTGLYLPTTARPGRLPRRRALLLPATLPSAASTVFPRSLPICRHWKPPPPATASSINIPTGIMSSAGFRLF